MLAALKEGLKQGYEPAYNFFSINGRTLGHGAGDHVLFHILNASASEIRSLATSSGLWRLTVIPCRIPQRCRRYG
jgi:hypothetical protein